MKALWKWRNAVFNTRGSVLLEAMGVHRQGPVLCGLRVRWRENIHK